MTTTIRDVGSSPTYYHTIQEAIDDSDPGDTIVVHAGTYHEQIQIIGHALDGLTIQAAPGNLVFIEPPAVIIQTADSPTSGRDIYSLVTVNGADNVTIAGLIVDGQQRGAEGEASGGTLAGISYINADGGLIDHVVVTGIRDSEASFGNQSGVGIYVLNSDPSPGDPNTPPVGASLNSIEIRNSTVQDFQKAAIVANYGNVDIHDNTIIGHGATTANSQDGIQVSHSTGSIDHNDVTDIGLVDPGYTSVSSGILAFEDRDLVIDNNNVVGTGATNASFGVVMQNSVGGAITDNHVSHVGWGVDVEDSPSFADPMVPGSAPGFTYDYSSNTISDVGFNSAYFAADPVSTDAFHVVGTDGNDVIRTGGGDDLIVDGVGDGNDVYDGGNGIDTVDYSSATSSVTVDLAAIDRSAEPGGTVANLLVNAGYFDDTPVGKATGLDTGTDALINIENVIGGQAGDDITGDAANNVIVGGGGADSLDGGGGIDTASYAASLAAAAITINVGSFTVATGGAEGSDTLTNIERVHSAAANDILLVGNGGYASIQDAIDAAQDGDTIVVAAGTYGEHLVIDKDVTIVGPNRGIAGTDPRGAEAIITGGIEITADGVTLDGLKIDGSHVVTTAVTDAPNGIFINASHVAVENSILTGDVADSRPFSTTGSVTDLDFSHNSVSGWSEGAYITAGATGSIDHNDFTTNGNDIVTESVSMIVSNNSFEDSVGSHIAAVPFDATVDVSTYIASSNTFSADHPRPISIYPNHTGAETITGTDFNETFKGGDPTNNGDHGLSTGPFTFHGAGGDDKLIGGDLNDTLDGGAGADQLIGGAGTDTATYASSSAGVSINLVTGVGHGGDAEGDTLSGIENVIGSSHNDTFVGDASANVFTGGNGNDIYTVSDSDTVVEVGGSAGGIDEVRSAQTITLVDSVENLTLIDGVSDVQTFDDMNLGAITDGENGWQVNGPNAPRDQEIVDFGGGNHKFRMSSDPAVADFAGPYSPELSFAAGEHATGASFDSQSIDFDFQAVNAVGDGSRIEVDFGIASGQDRNNFLVLESFSGGIRIAVSEPDTNGDFSGNGVDPAPNDWRQLTSGVDASVQHHLTMKLHYVDGPDNDVIQVFLDDNLIGTTTTTFENYRDALGGPHAGHAFDNLTDRVFFRPSANGAPNDGPLGANQGFYFDNLETAVYNSANVNGTGNALANVITGNSGDNVLTGLAGNDSLDGGAGNDTAAYTDVAGLNAGSFLYNFASGHWTVSDATEGTDTLTSVGMVSHTGLGRFFLVGPDSDFTSTAAVVGSLANQDKVVVERSVAEGTTIVANVNIFGPSNSSHFAITAFEDGSKFQIDGFGNLRFKAGPDFENPGDVGHDNVYRVQFQTNNISGGYTITQIYNIRVTNVVGHTVNGSGRADSINGSHGPTGPQAVSGFATSENDVIRGNGGSDFIRGLGGNDTITGGIGNDRLFGDGGNDRLFGNSGNDRLNGGDGNDQMSGGAGIDRFLFDFGSGHDTVLDYVAGTDKIDLTGTGAHGFAGIHLVKSGANVDIHVGSDILTLAHTTIATINAHHSDFIFA